MWVIQVSICSVRESNPRHATQQSKSQSLCQLCRQRFDPFVMNNDFKLTYNCLELFRTRKGSNLSSFEATGEGVADNSTRDSPLRRGSVTTLDETLSINDAGEWTRVHYEYNSIETNSKEMWIDR